MINLLTCCLPLFAAPHSSVGQDPAVALGILLVLVVVGLVAYLAKRVDRISATQKQNDIQAANLRRYQAWLKKIEGTDLVPIDDVELPLDAGEMCYLQMAASLCEPRAIRQSVHTGGGVRIARGVVIGQGYSSSESHEEWRRISSGRLYITDRRIVFDGDMQNRTIKLSDLLSVQQGNDYIVISSDRRTRSMAFYGLNGLIAGDMIKRLKRQADID